MAVKVKSKGSRRKVGAGCGGAKWLGLEAIGLRWVG